MPRKTIQEELRDLRKLKADRDKKKQTFSAAELKFKQAQQRIFDRMEAEELGSVTDKRTKTMFVPAETVYANVQDLSEFLEWARNNDDTLIVEKAMEGELNTLVRERLDNGETLPPGISFTTRQYISQRAA